MRSSDLSSLSSPVFLKTGDGATYDLGMSHLDDLNILSVTISFLVEIQSVHRKYLYRFTNERTVRNYAWTGGCGDGLWFGDCGTDVTNWSIDGRPTLGPWIGTETSVGIADGDVRLDDRSVIIASLDHGGSLVLAAPLTLSRETTAENVTIAADLTLGGAFAIRGASLWTEGAVSASGPAGAIVLDAASRLDVRPGASGVEPLRLAARIRNFGTLALGGSASLADTFVLDGGEIANETGGNLEIRLADIRNGIAAGGIENAGTLRIAAPSSRIEVSVRNAPSGLLELDGGTTLLLAGAFDNQGLARLGPTSSLTLDVPLAQLNGDGTGLLGGSWVVGDGARLDFGSTTLRTSAARIQLFGHGVLAQLPTRDNALGAIFVNDGEFSLFADAEFSSGGDVANNALVSIDGTSRLIVEGRYVAGPASETLVAGELLVGREAVIEGLLVDGGRVAAPLLRNRCRVAPGASPGRLVIDGDFKNEAGGIVEIEIIGAEPGTGYDQLVVDGVATLEAGSAITLLFPVAPGESAPFLPSDGTQFNVLEADKIIIPDGGDVSTVIDLSQLPGNVELRPFVVDADAGQALLFLTGPAVTLTSLPGLNAPRLSTAVALADSVENIRDDDVLALALAIDRLPSDAGRIDGLDQASLNAARALTHPAVIASRLFTQTIDFVTDVRPRPKSADPRFGGMYEDSRRDGTRDDAASMALGLISFLSDLQTARDGEKSGLTLADTGLRLFASGHYSTGDVEADGSQSGCAYQAASGGVGLAYEWSDTLLLGLAANIGSVDTDVSAGRGDGEALILGLTGFLRNDFDNGLAADLRATIGYTEFDYRRRVSVPGASFVAEGSGTGLFADLGGRLGLPFGVADDLEFEPYVIGDLLYSRFDGYTESGGGGASLAIRGDETLRANLGAGVEGRIRRRFDGGRITASAHVELSDTITLDGADIVSRFVGSPNQPMMAKGDVPDGIEGDLGARFAVTLDSNLEFSVGYRYRFVFSDYDDHGVTGRILYRF